MKYPTVHVCNQQLSLSSFVVFCGLRLCCIHSLHCLISLAHLQVDDGVGAVALHGVELQVSLEVLGVEPRYRQAVAKSSLRRSTKKEDQVFGEDSFWSAQQ